MTRTLADALVISTGARIQLVLDVVVLLGLLGYLPRALRRKKLRFAVIVLIGVVVAAIWANLHGAVLSR